MKKYYGWNLQEERTMVATVTGQMIDGTFVYTECDGNGEIINIDNQYRRTLKYGQQMFILL